MDKVKMKSAGQQTGFGQFERQLHETSGQQTGYTKAEQ